jgi:hypothetical protein
MAATFLLGTKPDGTVAPLRLDATGAVVVASTAPSGVVPVPGIGGTVLLGTKPDGTVAAVSFTATGAVRVASA